MINTAVLFSLWRTILFCRCELTDVIDAGVQLHSGIFERPFSSQLPALIG